MRGESAQSAQNRQAVYNDARYSKAHPAPYTPNTYFRLSITATPDPPAVMASPKGSSETKVERTDYATKEAKAIPTYNPNDPNAYTTPTYIPAKAEGPGGYAAGTELGNRLTHTLSSESQRIRGLDFPSLTQQSSHLNNVYRAETAEGYIRPDDPGLSPILSGSTHHSVATTFSRQMTQLADKKIVTWNEGDKENPWNWSKARRWFYTAVVAIAVVQVAFMSAIVTGDFGDQMEHFGVSAEVINLTVTLPVCGFGIGPLLWSPLSELYGRRPLWLIPFVAYIVLNIGCALAPNIGCLLACRFLAGFFASGPLTLAGGTIADMWGPQERGFAIAIFAAAPYGGPVLGPLLGGFIGKYANWRWLYWVNMCFAFGVWCFLLILPETFAPILLKRRAKKLRRETGDNSFVTEQEVLPRPISEIVVETLIRPFQMLVEEPILLLMSLYVSLVYGLLYAYFFSFPVVFVEGYGWDDAKTGITFCSVLIGVALALLVTPLLEKRYLRKGTNVTPEDRLPGMLVGGPWVPISLFIFGWTAPPYVQPHGGSWVGPTISGIPFGFVSI